MERSFFLNHEIRFFCKFAKGRSVTEAIRDAIAGALKAKDFRWRPDDPDGGENPTFHIEVSPQRRAQHKYYQRAVNYCQEKLPKQTVADTQGLAIHLLPDYDNLGRVAMSETEFKFDMDIIRKKNLDVILFATF